MSEYDSDIPFGTTASANIAISCVSILLFTPDPDRDCCRTADSLTGMFGAGNEDLG